MDSSGATKSHVFRGKVELRLAGGRPRAGHFSARCGRKGFRSGRVIVLGANESATVEAGQGRAIKVVRDSGQSKPPAFARQMPKWVRIKLFNTGVGLRGGRAGPALADRRPHRRSELQAAAGRRHDRLVSEWLANDSRSQWISLAGDSWSARHVTYRFRTTFELAGVLPRTAVLRGRLAADDRVRAIYLNGRKVFSAAELRETASAFLPCCRFP